MRLSIDLGGTDIKVGLVDGGTPLAVASTPVVGSAADLDAAVTLAARLLAGTDARPTATGVAVPGVVDRRSGRMLHANAKYGFLRDAKTDLAEWAELRFGAPAIVENDARAALAGELAVGVGRGERDAVMVVLGTGVGTAAAMDGVLLRGAHDHAGILGGHVTVDFDGATCPCGNIGCVEALASTRALREQRPDLGGIGELVDAARTDAGARRILADYTRVWGSAVVTLCHMYDPDLVILSGGVLRGGAAIARPVQEYVEAHLWPSSHRPRFAVPAHPELSVILGLAALTGDAAPAPAAVAPAAPATRDARVPELAKEPR